MKKIINEFWDRKVKSFSMGELIIALGVIAIIAMIVMPMLNKAKPDENEMMHKKATYVLERIVNEISTDAYLYPKSGEYSGLSNTDPVTVDGVVHSGDTKFCTLFASRLNKAAGTSVKCEAGEKSVTSVEGIDWYLPVSDFKGNDTETIKIDVNGSKGPNCMMKNSKCYHPDQFLYQVRKGTKIATKTPGNLADTEAPVARPQMPDAPNTDTKDPRTGQKWYCIRCSAPANGKVYGFGCNKPNGHYQLVAIPNIGYKGSWFTKSVTVNNADVPESECAVTFTPIVDIPKPDGGTVTPPPTPPEPTEPEKTYCINVTKIGGDTTQCAVAGDGCGKKPGTYTVSASGKGDYKTNWTSKDVTIVDKNISLTLSCDKEPEPEPCYSITTTGDTTNCPVTLPTGTCKEDKTKYTSGTYSYTVTPKAGYSFGGQKTASTKQVIITDKDTVIPIECAVPATETLLNVTWSGDGLTDVTVTVKIVPINGAGKAQAFTLKGDNGGNQTYKVEPGNYKVVATANGRNNATAPGAIGQLLNLTPTSTPNPINIPEGTTSDLTISLSDYAKPVTPTRLCIIPIFQTPKLPASCDPIPKKVMWNLSLMGPSNYNIGIHETPTIIPLDQRPCFDNITPGTYYVHGGASHWFVKQRDSFQENWWAQNGTGNIPSPTSINVPENAGEIAVTVTFSAVIFANDYNQ